MNAITNTTHRTARVPLVTSILAAGLLLAACGPNASITLSLDSSTVTMFLGTSQDVAVTLTRSADATAGVALSASGAPEWVTVSFNPSTLSGSALTSTMTIATDGGHPDAGPTTFTLAVSAQGPGLSATAQLAVVIEQLDVTGTVIGLGDVPLAGYTVFIPGHSAVVSAADGSFSIDNVAAPYDLTVADAVAGFSHTFVGLTSADPAVRPLGVLLTGSGGHSASVSGNLVHATLVPIPAGHKGFVCVEGVDVSVTGCDTVSAATSNYTVNMNWSGAATTSIRLRAYIVTVDADEEPLAIVANGAVTAFEISAGDADVTDVTVTSSSSQAVIGSTVTVPPGYSLSLRQLIATHSDVASISLGNLAGSALTRDVIAPFFVGADYTVAVAATANASGSNSTTLAWATGLAPGDSASLELARPPVQLSPPEAATGVTTGTEFAVSNPDGGVTTFYGTASGGGSVFFITTDAHTVTIPDLASIGLPLPAATDYIWTVLTSHDVPTVNDAVTGAGYIGEYLHVVATSTGGAPGPTVNGRISTAETRSFTTQ